MFEQEIPTVFPVLNSQTLKLEKSNTLVYKSENFFSKRAETIFPIVIPIQIKVIAQTGHLFQEFWKTIFFHHTSQHLLFHI